MRCLLFFINQLWYISFLIDIWNMIRVAKQFTNNVFTYLQYFKLHFQMRQISSAHLSLNDELSGRGTQIPTAQYSVTRKITAQVVGNCWPWKSHPMICGIIHGLPHRTRLDICACTKPIYPFSTVGEQSINRFYTTQLNKARTYKAKVLKTSRWKTMIARLSGQIYIELPEETIRHRPGRI